MIYVIGTIIYLIVGLVVALGFGAMAKDMWE
jgi:hypothetical protein